MSGSEPIPTGTEQSMALFILDGLADLLDVAAHDQASYAHKTEIPEWRRSDYEARAEKASELADAIRIHRTEVLPPSDNGWHRVAAEEWRRGLNRALSHALLGNID